MKSLLNGVTVIVKAAMSARHSRMLLCGAIRARQGDGVRRPRPGIRSVSRATCVRALRQHEDRGGDDLVGKGRLYIAASCRCAHYLVDPLPARQRRAGRRARSRTRSGWFVNALHAAAAVQNPRRFECLAVGQMHRYAKGTGIQNWPNRRSGRCSKPSDRSSFPMPAGSTDSRGAGIGLEDLLCGSTTIILVTASAVGRPVEVHAYADRIVIPGRAHRCRACSLVRPRRYRLRSLALRAGAGSQTRSVGATALLQDWCFRLRFERVRRKLASADDGNRQMVDILNAVLTDGLPAVEAACAEAIAHGVHSADVVLNILARQRDPAPPANILTPAALTLRHAPIADCARYDNLRRTI